VWSPTVTGEFARKNRTLVYRRIEGSDSTPSTGHGGTSQEISGTYVEYFFRRSSDGIQRMKQFRRRRSKIFIYTQITASLPFIEVDLNLTPQQMSLLINGLKYIQPCQSRSSRKPMEQILTEQYKNISTTVKACLRDNRMSKIDRRAQQAFSELERMLRELPLKKVPKRLGIRAQREHKIIRSIQRLLRQRPDVIVCQVDKTKTLYFGNAAVNASKAHDYMTKTKAYQEITDGRSPLVDSFHAVQKLLDDIVKTKGLTEKQSKKLRPNQNTLELAHYHTLPKVHKVS
jgi:hypothetical protein